MKFPLIYAKFLPSPIDHTTPELKSKYLCIQKPRRNSPKKKPMKPDSQNQRNKKNLANRVALDKILGIPEISAATWAMCGSV